MTSLELQTVCLQDGIMNALNRLVAMAYADDLKAVSGTHAGLQRIIDLVKTTLKMALDRQRDKSHHDDVQP
jgi:hypothetical protein